MLQEEEEKFNFLGVDLVEKLCYRKEWPVRQPMQNPDWLKEILVNNQVFWKRFEDNIHTGLIESIIAYMFFLRSDNCGPIRDHSKRISKATIAERIERMKIIHPRFWTYFQFNCMMTILENRSADYEIMTATYEVLWELINPANQIAKLLAEEANNKLLRLTASGLPLLTVSIVDIEKVV